VQYTVLVLSKQTTTVLWTTVQLSSDKQSVRNRSLVDTDNVYCHKQQNLTFTSRL